jgi:hypothetical protein
MNLTLRMGEMGDGRWEMGDGRWQMADGRWETGRLGDLSLNPKA